ncbi:hypothetical protein BDV39DRAFT_205236 [Aspergillus sergii]|uniref:Uncharacterized protein n=1 Tax=Aspergillus sergii TaxID=1034303 RepID=A0A5N6X2H2_9EURO|nr:hypothetical protein BDV39DRAFT_205236 [Aspergillus sergii]
MASIARASLAAKLGPARVELPGAVLGNGILVMRGLLLAHSSTDPHDDRGQGEAQYLDPVFPSGMLMEL